MTKISLAARTLAELRSPWFCPRCFWLKLRLQGKLPFQSFPGIFSSIDSYTKTMTSLHWRHLKAAPSWVSAFGDIAELVESPHWSRFKGTDEATQVELRGVPDLVFRQNDESYGIIDFKTARLTEGQDILKPLYEVQLNVYAWIAERFGFSPVSKIGLVYFEPQTDMPDQNLLPLMSPAGFALQFKATPVALPLRLSLISRLMQQARDLADLKEVPVVRLDCRNCREVESLAELVEGSHAISIPSLKPTGMDLSQVSQH